MQLTVWGKKSAGEPGVRWQVCWSQGFPCLGTSSLCSFYAPPPPGRRPLPHHSTEPSQCPALGNPINRVCFRGMICIKSMCFSFQGCELNLLFESEPYLWKEKFYSMLKGLKKAGAGGRDCQWMRVGSALGWRGSSPSPVIKC